MDADKNVVNTPSDRHWLAITVAVLLTFAALELAFSAHHFLDDAFIHLRIAHQLLDHGCFEYNDGVPGFVTSSPLYTTVLALFSLVSRSPLVPKVENVLVYLGVLALIVRRLLTCASQRQAALVLAALVVVTSPMGVRWLTDGMETGMVMLLAILLAAVTDKISARPPDAARGAAAALLGAAAVFLRVEFGYLLAVSIVAVGTRGLLDPATPNATSRWKRAAGNALPFVVGGLAGVALILALFGHLLPDTAVAKQVHTAPVLTTLKTLAAAHAGASFFGVGMFTLWAISAALACRGSRPEVRAYALAANSGMGVFLLLLIVTGQSIQGVRYFVFIETFLTALNILALPDEVSPFHYPRTSAAMAFIVLLWIGFDATVFYRISEVRSETYRRFAGTDYTFLANKKALAYDIGFVGYFTHAYILDANGLVNGRASAKLNIRQRLAGFARDNVDGVFLNADQLQEVGGLLDLSQWKSAGTFDFPNFSGRPDTHLLLVRPTAVAAKGAP